MKIYLVIEDPRPYTVDNSYRRERGEHPFGNIVGIYSDKSKADKHLEKIFQKSGEEKIWIAIGKRHYTTENDYIEWLKECKEQWLEQNNVWEFDVTE